MIYDEEVSEYINSAPETQKQIMQQLRDIMLGFGGISESLKWNQPVFSKGVNIAYLRSNKAHVTLGFFDGTGLSDPNGELLGSGKKMRFTKLESTSDINEQMIEKWLMELIE